MFPEQRLSRLRKNAKLRNLVRDTRLSIDQVVMPYFVCPRKSVKKSISSMPGNYQLSIDKLKKEIIDCVKFAIYAVLLFSLPSKKDEHGCEAYELDAIVQQGIKSIKDTPPDILSITDVCLCEY